jgi:lysozyme family protein
MKKNYNDILNRVLKSEGGYTNDPRDPGGPTNFGITLSDYRAYINRNGNASDVRRMNVDQAKAIYKSKYWDKVNGDSLPSGVDYTVMDYGVNSGVGRAQRVYNQKKTSDSIRTINAINDERLAFLHRLPTWDHFGPGWNSRVASVRQHSIDLARQPVIATEHKSAGAVVAGGAVAASQYPHLLPYILAGTMVLAGLVWLGVWLYKRKHK